METTEEGEKFVVDSSDIKDGGESRERRETRENWKGQFEFVLSLIGYTVGVGNIWRFPYVCYRNGGGTFLIPFFLFLVLCGSPLYYLEVCLGQFSGQTVLNIWAVCPLVKGIGYTVNIMSFLYIWNYGIVMSWILFYLVRSFYPTLGWASCGNPWNSPQCVDGLERQYDNGSIANLSILLNDSIARPNDVTVVTGNTSLTEKVNSTTPGLEFWQHVVLGQSSGIDDFGGVQWHLLGGLVFGWFLTFLCLAKGIKTLGKVVYVTATAPYFLLTVLLIRGVTLDGAGDGLSLFFTFETERLLHGQVWIEAALQVFYSLGPAWGGVITMASFNKFNHNALRDTLIVCFADMFTAVYGALVVFSVVGFLTKSTGMSVESLQFSGPGLAFIAYPEALSRLPLPQLWSVLFFFTLIFLGLDTQFTTFETVSNTIIDLRYSSLQRYRVLVTLALVVFITVTSIPLACSNGIYIFQLIDWYMAPLGLTFVAILEIVAVCWLYGANRFCGDIAMMLGKRPGLPLRISWCFLTLAFLIAILVMTLFSYAPPGGKGGYVFPTSTIIFGNFISTGELLIIFVVAAMQIWKGRGSIRRKMTSVITASSSWEPNDEKQAEVYRLKPYRYEKSFTDRIKYDILGIRPKNHSQ